MPSWLAFGLLDLSFWSLVAVMLILTHLTIVSVTIFLHRAEAHRSLVLHPILSHAFRFWLWLTTGMKTKEWVAVHRKHHAKCETEEDPHSPKVYGILTVLFKGMLLYKRAAADPDVLLRYGSGTPDDSLERRLYTAHPWLGIGIMAFLELALFGLSGLPLLFLQLAWIPFWAAGVINGVGHFAGYRTHDTPDLSTNIIPFGFIIGGEELHNNHHAFPTSAKFSVRWYECDVGWAYIRLFALLCLLSVKRSIPALRLGPVRDPDEVLLSVIVTHRYRILRQYVSAMRDACRDELRTIRDTLRDPSAIREYRAHMQLLCSKSSGDRTVEESTCVSILLSRHPALATMERMRSELCDLWTPSRTTREDLLRALQSWCRKAEESRIAALERFSRSLRRMSAV